MVSLDYHHARRLCLSSKFRNSEPHNHSTGNFMPTYHVEMMEGRTIEQKKKLVAEITRVSVEVLGGAPDAVDIIITDIKRENWATGGKLWSEPRD
jgi:4-oxalocrotonate tautomerase